MWTIWPRELYCKSFFQRNMQYRPRLKSPHKFFRHCETFLKICYCLQRVPLHFLIFCNIMDVKKSERAPLLVRQGPAPVGLRNTSLFQVLGFSTTVKENTWHFEVFVLFLSPHTWISFSVSSRGRGFPRKYTKRTNTFLKILFLDGILNRCLPHTLLRLLLGSLFCIFLNFFVAFLKDILLF